MTGPGDLPEFAVPQLLHQRGPGAQGKGEENKPPGTTLGLSDGRKLLRESQHNLASEPEWDCRVSPTMVDWTSGLEVLASEKNL